MWAGESDDVESAIYFGGRGEEIEFCAAPVIREAIKSPPLSTLELYANPRKVCFPVLAQVCTAPTLLNLLFIYCYIIRTDFKVPHPFTSTFVAEPFW